MFELIKLSHDLLKPEDLRWSQPDSYKYAVCKTQPDGQYQQIEFGPKFLNYELNPFQINRTRHPWQHTVLLWDINTDAPTTVYCYDWSSWLPIYTVQAAALALPPSPVPP